MKITINSIERILPDTTPETPLLYVLRNDLNYKGAKFGCGLGECGACTVLIDGKPARSCQVPVSAVLNNNITTIEGLSSAKAGELHPVQQAFIDEQAAQCGYCTNGMIMTLVALLRKNPVASEVEIKDALAFNLCRCGTHLEILKAAERAKQIIAQEGLSS